MVVESVRISYYDTNYLSTMLDSGSSLATFSLQSAFTLESSGTNSNGVFGRTWAELNDTNAVIWAQRHGQYNSYTSYTGAGSASLPSDLGTSNETIGYDIWAAKGPDTCKTKTGAINCTEVCSGGFGDMFDYLPTFHNCIILPNITTTKSQTIGTVYDVNNQILNEQFYQPAAKVVGDNVADKVGQCLKDYCDSLPGCTDHVDRYSQFWHNDISNLYGTSGYGYFVIQAICDNVPSQVLSDVGGIGVYLSYWIQPGVALLAFHLTIFWLVLGPYAYLLAYAVFRGPKGARRRVKKAEKMSQRHLSRLAVALVDFHKAQCFFMVATNIAAMVVIKSAGLQPATLQQAYNTFYLLRMVAVNGYLPVTFCLFNLHILGMVSWYLITLSIFSISLSVGTLVTSGDFGPAKADVEYLRSLASTGGPSSCDNRQPGIYCWNDYSYDHTSSPLLSTNVGNLLAFCLSMFALLVLAKLRLLWWRWLTKSKPWWIQLWKRSTTGFQQLSEHPSTTRATGAIKDFAVSIWEKPTTQRIANSSASTSACNVGHTLYLYTLGRFQQFHYRHHNQQSTTYTLGILLLYTFYVIFYALYIQFFVALFHQLGHIATQDFYNPDWNFGQVVALSVWLPPLCEWVYLELRGVRKGFRYRLRVNHYEVVRRDEEEGSETQDGNSCDQYEGKGANHPGDDLELERVNGISAGMRNAASWNTRPEENPTASEGLEGVGSARTRSDQNAEKNVAAEPVVSVLVEEPFEQDRGHPSRPPSYRVQPAAYLRHEEQNTQDEVSDLTTGASTPSSISSSGQNSREQRRREDDGYWLLPEPELPSRSITLSGGHGYT